MGVRTPITATVIATCAVLGGAGVAAAQPDPVSPAPPIISIPVMSPIDFADSFISGEAGRWTGGVVQNPTITGAATFPSEGSVGYSTGADITAAG